MKEAEHQLALRKKDFEMREISCEQDLIFKLFHGIEVGYVQRIVRSLMQAKIDAMNAQRAARVLKFCIKFDFFVNLLCARI